MGEDFLEEIGSDGLAASTLGEREFGSFVRHGRKDVFTGSMAPNDGRGAPEAEHDGFAFVDKLGEFFLGKSVIHGVCGQG